MSRVTNDTEHFGDYLGNADKFPKSVEDYFYFDDFWNGLTIIDSSDDFTFKSTKKASKAVGLKILAKKHTSDGDKNIGKIYLAFIAYKDGNEFNRYLVEITNETDGDKQLFYDFYGVAIAKSITEFYFEFDDEEDRIIQIADRPITPIGVTLNNVAINELIATSSQIATKSMVDEEDYNSNPNDKDKENDNKATSSEIEETVQGIVETSESVTEIETSVTTETSEVTETYEISETSEIIETSDVGETTEISETSVMGEIVDSSYEPEESKEHEEFEESEESEESKISEVSDETEETEASETSETGESIIVSETSIENKEDVKIEDDEETEENETIMKNKTNVDFSSETTKNNAA